jgi:sugar (pentulose or hexulose) kinase
LIYETSGLGAAINCAVGSGIFENYTSAVKEMTRVGEVFEPNYGNHRLYNALYYDVYKKMYKKLKPFYKKIMEITGYPN